MVSALFFVSLAVADNAAASSAETKALEATQEAGSGGAAETETKKEFWTKFAINLQDHLCHKRPVGTALCRQDPRQKA